MDGGEIETRETLREGCVPESVDREECFICVGGLTLSLDYCCAAYFLREVNSYPLAVIFLCWQSSLKLCKYIQTDRECVINKNTEQVATVSIEMFEKRTS